MLKLVTMLKDYSQPLSLEALIARNPQSFDDKKLLKLDLQKPIAIHVDASVTPRLREAEPENTEMSYPLHWVVHQLEQLGLPKDKLTLISSVNYKWDGDRNGNEIGFVIKLMNHHL
ncbi:hypothetical protein FA893_15885 [Photobacterium damselae subsp. piscicida]|uniref:hypothetical protein n=1 Tax=Photobacterium damselae TaxID=38293 RepID=UPI0005C59E9F|nr:hypothetical protein [Photobacterium damselae]OLQ80939.1 hypothetical protein BEI67_13390 [Photobacterium damselae subsp. piscicida]TFZ62470.1 hypothetical protein E4T25_04210 [Photobacterium damselae subsp. piscicida]TJZ85707.1 hypothetical protein FA893_15885 [Photobacterium damselae subsp. piscicida]BBC40712.1 hypothetical protein PDPE_1-01552 [Photobacterium damselae subsp. piscicida]